MSIGNAYGQHPEEQGLLALKGKEDQRLSKRGIEITGDDGNG